MANTLQAVPINTLSEFINFIESTMIHNETLWYRGTEASKSNKLIPSLYRNKNYSNVSDFLELEKNIINKFQERSMPYLQRPLTTDIENLFIMQHFGVPTRLLDWTENPIIALFFSLTSIKKDSNGNYTSDAAIWMVNPILWNRSALSKLGYSKGIVSIFDAEINGYTPGNVMREHPIAIYGKHNSPRIVAQKGVFVLFGTNTNSMEEIYVTEQFPKDCLIKLEIDKANIDKLLLSLISIGVTDSVVYPDLDGLSKEIKRLYKFEV